MRSACVILAISILSGQVSFAQQSNKVQQDQIRISEETTRVTAPLTSQGFVNYAEYLNQKKSNGITPETNAAVMYWRAIGPENESTTPEFRKKVCEKLGVDVFAGEGPFVTSISRVAKSHGISDFQPVFDEMQVCSESPWISEDHPLVAEWLKANETPLKLATEGSLRPHYYNPLIVLNENDMLIATLLPNVQMYREIARGYRARAMLSLGEGNVDRAIEDLMSMHRLARHTSNGSTLIEMLVGVAIDAMACDGDRVVATNANLTGAELQRWNAEIASLPPMRGFRDIIDEGERYMGLDSIQGLVRGIEGEDESSSFDMFSLMGVSSSTTDNFLTKVIFNFSIDWNTVLIEMNGQYDRMIAVLDENETHQARKSAFELMDSELKGRTAQVTSVANVTKYLFFGPEERGRQLSTVLQGLLTPAMSAAMEADTRGRQRVEVTRVGLAIEAYKADKGQLPTELSVLAPNYLKSIPLDRYTNGPLSYQLRGDEYAVYSVGKNLQDDNGKTYDDGERNQFDDIVFRSNSWVVK